MASFRAAAAFFPARRGSFLAMAALMDGTRLMLKGYIKDAGRAKSVMPKVYSPYKAAASTSLSPRELCSVPRTRAWSSSVMRLMPTDPKVTGMPIFSTCPSISSRLSGTSVPRLPRCDRSSHTASTIRAMAAPTVTPKMAPAAHSLGAAPRLVSSHAAVRPTSSLHADSMTWLTAVGRISPRPWV